jgi:single-strand DNA-binding protein
MQQITGRLTADAIVKTLDSGKDVVNFSIADNEQYKRKGTDEQLKFTTFFSCSYWANTAIAQVLRKGAVVQISGRISARAYTTNTGDAAASLNLHANRIEVLAYAQDKTASAQQQPKEQANSKKTKEPETDDLPF